MVSWIYGTEEGREQLLLYDHNGNIDIYPLTIVRDRYSGTYSGGKYTAWNLDVEDMPEDISDDDMTCMDFWAVNKIPVGVGATPFEALEDLKKELMGLRGKEGYWIQLGHRMGTLKHPMSVDYKCSLCGFEEYTLFIDPPMECRNCGGVMTKIVRKEERDAE